MPYGIDYQRIEILFVVKPARVYPPEAAPKATRAVLLLSLFYLIIGMDKSCKP